MSTLAKARMPGRMELISRKPMIVVDGAHNPAGVKALVATLDGAFHVAGERRCVLGMLSGRDIDDMVEPLVSLGFTEFHCCAPHSPRAVPASEVAERGAPSRRRRVRAPERASLRWRTRASVRPTRTSSSSRAACTSSPRSAARCCGCALVTSADPC